MCVTQTGGVLDNTAACSLWTAIRWPSRCITERRRKTDIKRIREEGEKEAAATHQNWPTCIFSFSLSLAYADLQLAFTLQHRALLCWSWEQTIQQRRGWFVRFHYVYPTVVIRTSASKRKREIKKKKEEKICSSHVHSSLFLEYTSMYVCVCIFIIQEHYKDNICQIREVNENVCIRITRGYEW